MCETDIKGNFKNILNKVTGSVFVLYQMISLTVEPIIFFYKTNTENGRESIPPPQVPLEAAGGIAASQ